MDGAARGMPVPAGFGTVLQNSKGQLTLMVSKNIGIGVSNEVGALAILKAPLNFCILLSRLVKSRRRLA